MTTKKKKQQQQKARNNQAAAQRVHNKNEAQGKRWGLSLGSVGWGPVQVKDLKLGSDRAMGAKRSLGIAEKTTQLQRVMPRLRSSHRDGGVQVDVLEGTDMIATVASAEGGTLAGDILLKLVINPTSFANTRLKQYAPLYQRYRFTRIRFRYQPIANNLQTGQLLGFCDFDVENQLAGNDPVNLQRGAAHQGQRVVKISESEDFDMGQANTYTDLYTNTDGVEPRLSYQGVFYLLASSDIAAGLPLGNVYIDYVCEFTIPQLSESASFQACAYDTRVNFFPVTEDTDLTFYDLVPSQAHGSLQVTLGGPSVGGNPTRFLISAVPGSTLIMMGEFFKQEDGNDATSDFAATTPHTMGLTTVTGGFNAGISTRSGPVGKCAFGMFSLKGTVLETQVQVWFNTSFLFSNAFSGGYGSIQIIMVPPAPELSSMVQRVRALTSQMHEQQVIMARMYDQMQRMDKERRIQLVKREPTSSTADPEGEDAPKRASSVHTVSMSSASSRLNGRTPDQSRKVGGGIEW